MNKKLIIVGSIIAVAAIAILAWRLPGKSSYTQSTSTDTAAETAALPEGMKGAESVEAQPTSSPQPAKSSSAAAQSTPAPAPAQKGRYVDYSSSIIASTTGTKVLFFHAPWCPQCRALESSIQAGPIPNNVTIIKVDYDTNQALRQKYGVTIQTTLVRVDDSGKLEKKYSAYDSPTLDSLKANVL